MLENGTAVEADARDAGDCELDRQHVARLARGIVAGSTVDSTHRAIRKCLDLLAGLLIAVGVLIASGLDKRLETLLVQNSPTWLTELTTRY